MYLNLIFLDQFLFYLSCKNTHRNKHTHTDAHKDFDEHSIVFCKDTTIITESSPWILTIYGLCK